MNRSATGARVMNFFAPFSTKWSPSRCAVVVRPATSEPARRSVSAKALCNSPVANCGTNACASVSLPATIGRPDRSVPVIIDAAAEQTPATASMSRTRTRIGASVPPKRAGNAVANTPSRASSRKVSQAKPSVSPTALARGPISWRTR